MRKLIILAAALLGVCGAVQGQPNPRTAPSKGFFMDAWTQVGTSGKEFGMFDIAIAPGWAFNRTLFARVQFDAANGLWDVGGVKTWRENLTVGPALGGNVWRPHGSDATLALVGSAGRSLLNKEGWSHAGYDIGAEFYDNRFLVGLGVRHYDSFNSVFDRNRTSFYVKIGWKLFK